MHIEKITSDLKSGKYILRRKNGSTRVITINKDPSMTDEQFQKDTDVNNIIRKYVKTGQVSHIAKNPGQYADVSELPDLHDGLLKIKQAKLAFEQLPQKVREVAKSPMGLVKYLSDPKNDEQAVKLGLKTMPKKADSGLNGNSAASNDVGGASGKADKTDKKPDSGGSKEGN